MLNKLFLLMCVCGFVCSQNTPVFIWGSSSVPFKPALKTLSSNDFGDIISEKLDDSMVVLFLENNLQTADFSQCKLESGDTCFSNLKTFRTKTFYADVVKPIETIKSLTTDDKIENLDISEDNKFSNIKYEPGKILIIQLNENNEDRFQDLIKHDSIMAEIYNLLSEQGKVIAIYTSMETNEPLLKNRIKRQAKAEASKKFSGKADDVGILLYFGEIIFNKETLDITEMTLNKESSSKSDIDVTLKSNKGDIKFVVTESGGYWNVNEISLGTDNFLADVESQINFSYFCGNLTLYSGDKAIIFSNLQLQAFYKEEPTKFGDPWHCVGFISGGIISGLFVALMFIIILSIGITWLMDIRTMDRFDDPKGKTITINATD
ncbi:V-type proton ATPase subunit S1 [Condylostylus longicornis]|uniref:V-type proton ATPase subunit S1 n=1 Tax=Condylostylus longicornis TaxID=2530218 RepID=UPI00244E3D09|nr:V-type proton ATPase subunit S1 [Condylostylus longicornis]